MTGLLCKNVAFINASQSHYNCCSHKLVIYHPGFMNMDLALRILTTDHQQMAESEMVYHRKWQFHH